MSFARCSDIDCFYCAVERVDDPSLVGVPLAVEQLNSGGFVAVSYEARGAGIRCGDGAGAGGRASIPHLVNMGARSVQECRAACPGLVVRTMRPERYREFSKQVHALLRRLVQPGGVVERASCDDFYIDATALCTSSGLEIPALPSTVHIIGDGPLAVDLQRGGGIACEVRKALAAELRVTGSCGVARSKLVARLASPVNKPDGLTGEAHHA